MVALAEEIGWTVERLKTWSMCWLHDALQREYASLSRETRLCETRVQKTHWPEEELDRFRGLCV